MFVDDVITGFTTQITDSLFLYLQNDRELMKRYLEMSPAERDTVNRRLGREVKERFGLENGVENSSPRSPLIDRYTQHYKVK